MRYNNSCQITMRLTEVDRDAIDDCVNNGTYMSRADFIRTAVREKIARIQGA